MWMTDSTAESAGVAGGCEPSDVAAAACRTLGEQQMLLPTEPPLQVCLVGFRGLFVLAFCVGDGVMCSCVPHPLSWGHWWLQVACGRWKQNSVPLQEQPT